MQRAAPYDLLARDFDRELGDIFEEFERPLIDALLATEAPPSGRVLDLACGTGRLAIDLARRGLEVVALDRSAAMIDRARRRRGAGRVSWRVGDMRRFALSRPAGLVTCLFDSMNHLMRATDVQRTLRCVARHLLPGGRFVFDVNTPLAFRRHWTGLSRVIERRDHSAVWRASYDDRRRQARLVADYFLRQEDGSYHQAREIHLEKPYLDNELRRWVGAAGLRVCEVRRVAAGPGDGAPCVRRAYVCQPVCRRSATSR